jgi:hypothetical protein
VKREVNIIELVQQDENLSAIRKDLISYDFLLPGIFNIGALMFNTKKIKSAWKRKQSKLHAHAYGAYYYATLYKEHVYHHLHGSGSVPTKETSRALSRWKKDIKGRFPDKFQDIDRSAGLIGQYVEFICRKVNQPYATE